MRSSGLLDNCFSIKAPPNIIRILEAIKTHHGIEKESNNKLVFEKSRICPIRDNNGIIAVNNPRIGAVIT